MPLVVIDTDPGIDDAMALLLAFTAHKRGEIRILGLTITHGNNNDIDMLAKYVPLYLLESMSADISMFSLVDSIARL